MNDKPMLTQKDLDLLDDSSSKKGGGSDDAPKGEGGGSEAPVDDAAKGEGKGEGKGEDKDAPADKGKADDPGDKSRRRSSILDDVDDDDDDDEGEGKKADDKAKSKDDDKGKEPPPSDEDDEEDGKEPPPSDDDWRERLADLALKGQEEKLTAKELSKARNSIMKRLERYKTQEAYALSGLAAQEKIRKGEYKSGYPGDDAPPEEIKAWRKANDIPEDVTGYELPEIKGFDWSENQESIDSFLEVAHEVNITTKQWDAIARWQADAARRNEEDLLEKMEIQDNGDREAADDDLRARYGIKELKPRKRMMSRVLTDEELLPEKRGEKIMNARYYDPETKMWRRLINDPYVASMFVQFGEYEFGDAGFTPNNTEIQANSRIEALEKMRNEDYNTFMRADGKGKSPADELLELRRDQEARAKRGRRPAA